MKQKLYIWFSFILNGAFSKHRELNLDDIAVMHEGNIYEILTCNDSQVSNHLKPEYWIEITDSMLDKICYNIDFVDYDEMGKENYKYINISTMINILKRMRK